MIAPRHRTLGWIAVRRLALVLALFLRARSASAKVTVLQRPVQQKQFTAASHAALLPQNHSVSSTYVYLGRPLGYLVSGPAVYLRSEDACKPNVCGKVVVSRGEFSCLFEDSFTALSNAGAVAFVHLVCETWRTRVPWWIVSRARALFVVCCLLGIHCIGATFFLCAKELSHELLLFCSIVIDRTCLNVRLVSRCCGIRLAYAPSVTIHGTLTAISGCLW